MWMQVQNDWPSIVAYDLFCYPTIAYNYVRFCDLLSVHLPPMVCTHMELSHTCACRTLRLSLVEPHIPLRLCGCSSVQSGYRVAYHDVFKMCVCVCCSVVSFCFSLLGLLVLFDRVWLFSYTLILNGYWCFSYNISSWS